RSPPHPPSSIRTSQPRKSPARRWRSQPISASTPTTTSSWKAWTQNELARAGLETECATLGPRRPDRSRHTRGPSLLASPRRADRHVRMRDHKIMVRFADVRKLAAYIRLVYAVAHHPWLPVLLAVHDHRPQSPARPEACSGGRHRSPVGTGRELEFHHRALSRQYVLGGLFRRQHREFGLRHGCRPDRLPARSQTANENNRRHRAVL